MLMMFRRDAEMKRLPAAAFAAEMPRPLMSRCAMRLYDAPRAESDDDRRAATPISVYFITPPLLYADAERRRYAERRHADEPSRALRATRAFVCLRAYAEPMMPMMPPIALSAELPPPPPMITPS